MASARELVFATGNRHKLRELGQMLAHLDVKVFSSADFPELGEIEETGTTFAQNALIKAHATAQHTGRLCLADDSGLEVDALNGQPGIYSARFAGPQADDAQNNARLLELLKTVPASKRSARFVCTIALCAPDGRHEFFEGACPGLIARTPAGNNGFGYDPLFVPDGFSLTFAQIAAEEKNRISHRARALEKLRHRIGAWL